MKDISISLNKVPEIFSSGIESQEAKFQYLSFNKQSVRIVPGLNVTKIVAPAFLVLERLAFALETVLNAGYNTIYSAYCALSGHEIIMLNMHKPIAIKEPVPKTDLDEAPMTADEDLILYEENQTSASQADDLDKDLLAKDDLSDCSLA